MENENLKWSPEEEDELQRAVQKHGAGKWDDILKDPEFASSMVNRSTIDLEDKWQNSNVVTESADLLTYEEAMKEACEAAAFSIAEAESKAILCAEAVRDMERIAKLVEENDAMLKIAEELYERCLNGEKFCLD